MMFRFKYIPLIALFILFFLSACSITPSRALSRQADAMSAQRVDLQQPLPQVLLLKGMQQEKRYPLVHVYLGGDGLPWINSGSLISSDPSIVDDLVLELLADDLQPSIFMGRPCYYQNVLKHPCSARLWTSDRYGADVVQQMSLQLQRLALKYQIDSFILIGYSGGASLAMLIAQHVDSVRAVVGIAGNVDTDAWVQYHNYSPLLGSLNPAEIRLRPIPYWLLVGTEDSNVPPITYAKLQGNSAVDIIVIDGFDHRCCWRKLWPQKLEQIQQVALP